MYCADEKHDEKDDENKRISTAANAARDCAASGDGGCALKAA